MPEEEGLAMTDRLYWNVSGEAMSRAVWASEAGENALCALGKVKAALLTGGDLPATWLRAAV